jgi:hypothetical protein
MLGERMSIEAIEAADPNEYVLLDQPETGEYQQVLSGILLWHTKDNDEILQKMEELRTHNMALFYVGTADEGLPFALSPVVPDELPDEDHQLGTRNLNANPSH